MLTTCKDCGRQLSAAAHVCPACGRPRKTPTPAGVKLAQLGSAAVLIAAIVYLSQFANDPGNGPAYAMVAGVAALLAMIGATVAGYVLRG